MSSIKKKATTLIAHGLEPYAEGKRNYKANVPEIEELALKRLEMIKKSGCKNFMEEPIDFFKVTDERIPELSGMMCGDCGCGVPYLIRQDLTKCNCWQE